MSSANRGKHGPNKLRAYLQTHHTVIERFKREGFVVHDGLELSDLGNGLLALEGEIECVYRLRIGVRKLLEIVDGSGASARVQTIRYSYNASLQGVGNVLRYDSPHDDEDDIPHHKSHHVHRFSVFEGDAEGTVELLSDEENWPTLGEVVEELRQWSSAYAERLAEL